jgi:hypothetical protein
MTDEVPNANNRSWWADWGNTHEVEECISPTPIVPVTPIIPIEDTTKYQPLISDLIIFETNKIDIYFIA